MDSRILQSIIGITGQRDKDSLDLSLVTTLAEILPASKITIIQKIREDITDKVKEVLKLSMTGMKPGGENHTTDDMEKTIIANSQIIDCMHTGSVVKQTLDGLVYFYFPYFL